MADRFLAWLSAGILAAGLSTGMLLSAGIATAGPDAGADGGSASGDSDTSMSQSSNSTDAQTDSADNADLDPTLQDRADSSVDVTQPVDDQTDTDAEDQGGAGLDDIDVDGETTEEGAGEGEVVGRGSTLDTPKSASNGPANARTFITDRNFAEISRGNERSPAGGEPAGGEPAGGEPAGGEPAERGPANEDLSGTVKTVETKTVETKLAKTAAEDTPDAPDEPAVYALAAPVETEQQMTGPTLLNVIGTLAWSLLDFVVKLVEAPPVVLPERSVTAGRSTLEIDCGDGYTADADWYYPKEGEPDKLIYFQHGFLARAFVYDRTLTELAERNNAIVVAPSITSNYFACDGCSLTADPMHAAVARLFEGDRGALLASAQAAGYEGTLPTEFVLSGQSAGSMLAAGAAGHYYDSAPGAEKANMVGVLLYDGSAANGALGRALDKLPLSVPVLNIAAEPVVFNYYGAANQLLSTERPGQFSGVQLINGAHSDAFQSSAYFGIVQAFVGLVFGTSAPENVEAVQVLSQGWLTDMYAGRVYDPATRTGIYGTPGEPGQTVVDIPTEAGLARGYVLPGPPHALSPFERIFAALVHSINSNDFVTCSTVAPAPPAQNSTPNTALSLDGRAITRQSVGQHVCMG
ncbi:hypothetical protein [Mycolicibacterium sp. XJ1819]